MSALGGDTKKRASAQTASGLGGDYLASLLADADRIVAEYRLSVLTQQTYEAHWRTFASCMTVLGHRCLPATARAVTVFVLWIIDNGDTQDPAWSATYVDGILAAVSDRHRQHGFADPVAAALTGQDRRNLRRILRRAQPVIHTRPVTTRDLRALVSVSLPRSLSDAARELALLIVARSELSLETLQRSELQLVDDELRLRTPDGSRLILEAVCRCRRSNILLQCCLRCAHDVWARHDRSWSRSGPWASLTSAASAVERWTGPEEVLDAAVLGRARPRALTFLRMRAWILLGFDRALRGQDLRGLLRREVWREDDRYRVRVRRGKNDPFGETVDFSVLRQADPLVCPVAALDAWFSVRDALIDDPRRAQQGIAFCPVSGGRLEQYSALTRMSDLAAWRRWCDKAGVRDLSQHGLRTGFIVEANRQKNSLEAISFTARHQHESTTHGSYLVAGLALNAPRPSPAGGVR